MLVALNDETPKNVTQALLSLSNFKEHLTMEQSYVDLTSTTRDSERLD